MDIQTEIRFCPRAHDGGLYQELAGIIPVGFQVGPPLPLPCNLPFLPSSTPPT
jgi:hypothetical protein